MNLADSVGHSENKRKIKYLDFTRELEMLWNMVTEIPIVVVALGTVSKHLGKILKELKIRGKIDTTQTTLLRSARILRRVQETRRDFLSLRLLLTTTSL